MNWAPSRYALFAFLLVWGILMSGCRGVGATLQPPETAGIVVSPTTQSTQTPAPSPTPTRTETPLPTATATTTRTSTPTLSPTITLTPTITPTATFDFPDFVVAEQANCRYGPGTAYLYAAGLFAGDHAEVRGRNSAGTWLYLRPDTIDYFCWAAASVGEVQGDVFSVLVWQPNLPRTTFIGPVSQVQASRSGSEVTVVWEPVQVNPPEDGRGYLIEAYLCQNGGLVFQAFHTDGNSYTFQDDPGCGNSSGLLYAVEKHGYTTPVQIPWP
jgi:hypothetical protein